MTNTLKQLIPAAYSREVNVDSTIPEDTKKALPQYPGFGVRIS